MDVFSEYMLTTSKYILFVLSLCIIIRCIRSMLSERNALETWAFIKSGRETVPVSHWENTVGRARSSDVRIDKEGISRTHAVLVRNDRGIWAIYDIFSKGGVWVNGLKVGEGGTCVYNDDIINLGGQVLRFKDISTEKRQKLESARPETGKRVSPFVTLAELTVFQAFLLIEHCFSANSEDVRNIAFGFAGIILLQWICYTAMRLMKRSGFEVEILAFYLTSIGMSVIAGSSPDNCGRQLLLTILGVVLFISMGWWLRKLKRSSGARIPVAVIALLLLALNVAIGYVTNGARNWIEIGGFSFQPSELVKAAYVYVGAATLDRLYRKKNLFGFIVFSAVCVLALAYIGDFGTALVFFVGFLIISFMRSGSIATVFLAVSSAVIAGLGAVTVKPYIAQRFSSWRHVWDDIYGTGYQQVRAMSAAASGGFFGKGAGSGWLSGVTAATTDMVFAVVCEELGLVIGICMVLALVTLTLFAVRSCGGARSSYYSIAACACAGMLLVQLSLNVFGTMDILPFTGVTFPFVSRGGTSLISCWIMMAFIKSADNRRGASFAVRPINEIEEYPEFPAETYSVYDEEYSPDGEAAGEYVGETADGGDTEE